MEKKVLDEVTEVVRLVTGYLEDKASYKKLNTFYVFSSLLRALYTLDPDISEEFSLNTSDFFKLFPGYLQLSLSILQVISGKSPASFWALPELFVESFWEASEYLLGILWTFLEQSACSLRKIFKEISELSLAIPELFLEGFRGVLDYL